MTNYIDKIAKEKIKLDKKISKLMLFILSEKYSTFTDRERGMLTQQYDCMSLYSRTLRDRLVVMREKL